MLARTSGDVAERVRSSVRNKITTRFQAPVEVVPQSDADLLLERVVELGLIAHAVKVLHSHPEEVSAAAAPHPAGLHGQVAAEIDLLVQVAVDGKERSTGGAGRLVRAEIGAELELPRLGGALDRERPARLPIKPQTRVDIRRQSKNQRLADVVEPIKSRDVRADTRRRYESNSGSSRTSFQRDPGG